MVIGINYLGDRLCPVRAVSVRLISKISAEYAGMVPLSDVPYAMPYGMYSFQ